MRKNDLELTKKELDLIFDVLLASLTIEGPRKRRKEFLSSQRARHKLYIRLCTELEGDPPFHIEVVRRKTPFCFKREIEKFIAKSGGGNRGS